MADATPALDETKLRRAFLEEADEMVGRLNRLLVDLEHDTANSDLVNEVFRLVHSLKSEAALMGYSRLSEVAHRTEDVFDRVKGGQLVMDRAVIDAIFAATDMVNEMIGRVSGGGGDADFGTEPVLEQLDRVLGRGKKPSPLRTPSAPISEALAEQKADLTREDREALEESRARRERLYRITCELEESCPMKLPRAYLIQSNLESICTVIRSVPTLEMPEDGTEREDDAYRRFVVYLTTSGPVSDLERSLSVDEVERFEIVPMRYSEVLAPRGPPPPAAARQQPRTGSGERTSIRVETKKLDDIWSLVGQLVITKGRLGRMVERTGGAEEDLRQQMTALGDDVGAIAEGLQRAMMDTRMVPISVLFDKLPRLIRDLSRHVGKEADLETRGESTEIDRSFVEALSDPLTHLIRNCLDHGLEAPEERVRAGKPERGKITASAYQEGGKVVVEVSDDGRGLDLERIRRKAERMGLVGHDEALTDAQIVELIFRPGFSTAQTVTDISGRGVGMDVVRTRVREALHGEVRVRSERGRGTRFSIVLPLTLTILNVLVVRLGGRQYAIPVTNVEETARFGERAIRTGPIGSVAQHRGEDIPVVFLADLLGRLPERQDVYDAVVVTHQGKRAYLVVDELVEKTDVVIKPVDDILNQARLFSGVSVLGDGRILLILSTTFVGD